LAALGPPAVVTVTSTVVVPAGGVGAVTVMPVELFTVKVVAGVVPKFTPVAPKKLVPVTVSDAPAKLALGLTPVTVGGGGRV
jgi:hypothetical protein